MIGKAELAKRTAIALKASGIKKRISHGKKTYTLIAPDGSSSNFTVQEPDRELPFTVEDVLKILEAMILVLKNCIRTGQPVKIRNFGKLQITRFKQSVRRCPDGEIRTIPAHYAPRFYPAEKLKEIAKDYANYLAGNIDPSKDPLNTDEDDIFYEDFEDIGNEEEIEETDVDEEDYDIYDHPVSKFRMTMEEEDFEDFDDAEDSEEESDNDLNEDDYI